MGLLIQPASRVSATETDAARKENYSDLVPSSRPGAALVPNFPSPD